MKTYTALLILSGNFKNSQEFLKHAWQDSGRTEEKLPTSETFLGDDLVIDWQKANDTLTVEAAHIVADLIDSENRMPQRR